MRVGVLGPLTVVDRDGTIDVAGSRQRRLLAALALHVGEVVSTDRLADIVFAGEPTAGAATTLRSYVARLRRALGTNRSSGDAIVRTEAPGYVLRLDRASIDAHRFSDAAARGRAQLSDGDAPGAVDTLRGALDLWHGAAYEEFVFEDWAQAEASRLEEERLVATEALHDALLDCGENDEAIPALRRMTTDHPLRERPRAQLMLALFRSGRQAEALREFQEYRRAVGELALDPSPAIVALDRSIVVQDPALLLDAPAGRSLRGYRLVEELGSGTHGVVWRAVQPGLGRDVAVKAIRGDLADQPGFIRRFDADAQTIARLEHPHIVPIHDSWREPGGAYIVQRLLPGDLRARIAAGPLPTEQVGELAAQLGSALTAAHREGVVHGDLKPSNVLLDDDANAFVTDFGTASLSPGTADGATSGATSGFEAPEQLAGEEATAASDQFAFAVLIANALTGTLPFGERSIASPDDELPSIHLHRPSVPPAVDDVLRRGASWIPDDRFPDVVAFTVAVVRALGGDVDLATAPDAPNPYVGLRAFGEADAGQFFGRHAATAALLERLRDDESSPVITLVGPSGSGKSSVVRAGVLPALRRGEVPGSDHWVIATMVPGGDPIGRLLTALEAIARTSLPRIDHDNDPSSDDVVRLLDAAAGDGTVLLVVDQLEELYTVVADERVTTAFAEGLEQVGACRDGRVRLLMTLRADFFDRPLRSHGFGSLVSDGAVALAGLSADELDAAVRGPAAAVGVDVDPSLSSTVVADVLDQPAALPLLQFAMTELFERRSGNVIGLDDYRRLGGVGQAIARRADEVFDRLDASERDLARTVFLRLVTVDGDDVATRRPAPLTALREVDERTHVVVSAFGDARLLAFDRDRSTREPTVELAHEALITAWPRLAAWVADAGDALRLGAHLEQATASWEQSGREVGELYRGARLDAALGWIRADDPVIAPAERQFVEASVAAREREEALVQERLDDERRANRRLRTVLVALAVVLVAALVAGAVAIAQRNSARDERARADGAAADAREQADAALAAEERADRQADAAEAEAANARDERERAETERTRADDFADTALARSLASAAVAAVDEDQQLALLLALEAARVGSADSIPEVTSALQASLAEPALEVLQIEHAGNGIARFSPDGERFVSLADGDDRFVDVWTVDPPSRVLRLGPHDFTVDDVAFTPDGSTIATSSIGLTVWDSHSGELLWRSEHDAFKPAISHDGRFVASGSNGQVRIFGVADGTPIDVLPLPAETGPHTFNMAFSPDDELLAVSYRGSDRSRHGLAVWHLADREVRWTAPFASASDVAFSPDGTLLYGGSGIDGTVTIWDAATGEIVDSFVEHRGPVTDLHVSADGRLVASGGIADVIVWDAEGDHDVVAELEGHTGDVDAIDITADGTLVLTSSRIDGTTRLWDLDVDRSSWEGPDPVPVDDSGRPSGAIAFSPDGSRLAASGAGGTVAVHDLDGGEREVEVAGIGAAHDLEFSADGALLAIAGGRGLTVVDPIDGSSVIRALSAPLASVDFVDAQQVLVAGREAGTAIVDVSDGSVTPLDDRITLTTAFSPDGADVVVAYGLDNNVWADVVDRSTGDLRARLPVNLRFADVLDVPDDELVHTDAVLSVEYSASGRFFATASRDGRAVAWDAASYEPVAVFDLGAPALDVAFHPTDELELATADTDGAVRVWDVETGTLRTEVASGLGPVARIGYGPDGSELALVTAATTDRDGGLANGVVQLHALDVLELVARAEAAVVRDFTDLECRRFRDAPSCG